MFQRYVNRALIIVTKIVGRWIGGIGTIVTTHVDGWGSCSKFQKLLMNYYTLCAVENTYNVLSSSISSSSSLYTPSGDTGIGFPHIRDISSISKFTWLPNKHSFPADLFKYWNLNSHLIFQIFYISYLHDDPNLKSPYILKKDDSSAKLTASAQFSLQLNPLCKFPGKLITNCPGLWITYLKIIRLAQLSHYEKILILNLF